MKIYTNRKITTPGLTILAMILLVTTISVAAPKLRANGKIAFTSDRDGNREIYVMNSDGTNQVRLTYNSIVDDFPAWSPDGTKIAFLSQQTSGGSAIFSMNGDGSEKEMLTSVNLTPGYWSMTWSPDGREIAFQDDRNIFIVNVISRVRRFLTVGSEPAWSPDGSKILFSVQIAHALSATPLHIIGPDGTNRQPLERSDAWWTYDIDSRWSPTGEAIVFKYVDFANENVIYLARADGSGRRPVYDQYGINIYSPAKPDWSPDGSKIVFDDYRIDVPPNSTREIFVINLDATGFKQLTNTVGNNVNPSWQSRANTSRPADFDGDGRSDISVFRPSDRYWYVNGSQAGFYGTQFGLSSDKLVPADYDGDGKTDIAVLRGGDWYWLNSSNGSFQAYQFGQAGDVPVPFDFTGDGRAELAVYRSGFWYTWDLANDQFQGIQFGIPTDRPVPADYDGDGRADLAVYRDGTWYLLSSAQGFAAVQFGLPSDKTVPADYDGDGRTDQAVYRDGTWYVLGSQTGFAAFQFGSPTDVPVPADYDGDGKTDAAVFRNGIWYSQKSTSGFSATQFGLVGDKPVPASFVPIP